MFTCFPFEKQISPTQISPIKFSDIKFQFHPSFHILFFFSDLSSTVGSTEFRLSFPQALQLTEPSPVAEYAAPFMRTMAPKQKKLWWDFFVDEKYD